MKLYLGSLIENNTSPAPCSFPRPISPYLGQASWSCTDLALSPGPKKGPGTHRLRMRQVGCTQKLGTLYIPVKYPVNYPVLVTSSCLNLLALHSTLNVPSTKGSFCWIESKLQEDNLLSHSFELNAHLPHGKRQYMDFTEVLLIL